MPTATATPHETRRRAPHVVHTDARPTGRQIFALCHALVDVAGLEWPETRAEASALLEHVSAQRAAIDTATAPTAGDAEIPF